ncbi:FecR family protein [Dyadobacter psychrotolerans]|uniref:FecR family protein n=1 Tax=Dyadobacter psychrotolerans TaxID=2541721 RepID=A0A4V2Z4F5_9BACT|nr:FecR family protein [Dyadobacter psychrotolerans]TDE16438.1 FecR family protein [Dyadobacter psychrotolerans]
MNYHAYTLTDFLEDAHFKQWVYEPTSETESFWKKFLMENPEMSDTIANAKGILQLLSADIEKDFPEHDQVTNMWGKIQLGYDQPARPVKSIWPRLFLLTGAAAMVILVAGWLFKPATKEIQFAFHNLISTPENRFVERKNITDKPIVINLPDKSQITLQPKSTIRFPKNFDLKTEREVILSGEAFFKIHRNPDRPFYVYANELVTKVLGTSFTIKAFDDDQEVEVVVKTGKVSVFTCQEHKNNTNSENATIITPNQKVLYSRKEEIIKKFLVDAPEMIVSTAVIPPIGDFQDVPVSKIFKNLEESYGIEIVYDEKVFGDCMLTASFSQESLYDKIDLICKGIEAEFAVVDAKILVSGKGCH